MVSFTAVAVASALACAFAPLPKAYAGSIRSRRLSFPLIAGYEPQNLVTDHNALDLDVAAMDKQLKKEAWSEAHHIYKDGAYSKNFAILTLLKPLEKAVPVDTKVTGESESGGDANGRTLAPAAVNGTSLQVQYHVTNIQDSYVDCQVGALWRTHEANLEGCFKHGNGTIKIENVGKYNYTYDVREQNHAGRTLAILSRTAETDMLTCDGCPSPMFQKFYDYYGQSDYGDKWVTAAFDGTATTLKNGNVDFTKHNNESRIEGVKNGVVSLNVWMAVIRKMEDAVLSCEKKLAQPVTMEWDEAVAFYTGSSEGTDGSGNGYLLHQLADDRCVNFHTCGADGDKTRSKVNHAIFQEFKLGQRNLLEGKCDEVRINKELIETHMIVPMIQGTLRYAHIQSNPDTKTQKAAAEGAAFAAAVLPIIHACNPNDAQMIYDNLKLGASSTNFGHVKNSLQASYQCMGITCEEVGGYYDSVSGEYFEGAAPCSGTGSSSSGGNAVGASVGVLIAVAAVIGAALFVVRRRRRTSEQAPPKKNPIFVTPDEPFT